jgi:hypothetical protein
MAEHAPSYAGKNAVFAMRVLRKGYRGDAEWTSRTARSTAPEPPQLDPVLADVRTSVSAQAHRRAGRIAVRFDPAQPPFQSRLDLLYS